jgi:1-deoxyxylulose-5-phosphate synthase
MNIRNLGRTGLKVSDICLGTMQFGWTASAETSHAIMSRAIELGCNFFDTADIYSAWAAESHPGKSEEIIGDWLQSGAVRRDELILATKVRGKMGPRPTDQGLSRHHILAAVEASLRRLRTDYIDLYQVHAPDPETPLDETLAALDNLVQRGLVRYIGCSNFPAWLLTKSLWLSEVRHWASFVSVQPHYNLVHRAEFERELQPLCLDQGVGVIPYSPLAAGFLTGKYKRDEPSPASPRKEGIETRHFSDKKFAALDVLGQVAAEHEASMAQTAIAWVLANPAVSSAIIGANTIAQLEETAGGAAVTLSAEGKAALDEATAWD